MRRGPMAWVDYAALTALGVFLFMVLIVAGSWFLAPPTEASANPEACERVPSRSQYIARCEFDDAVCYTLGSRGGLQCTWRVSDETATGEE